MPMFQGRGVIIPDGAVGQVIGNVPKLGISSTRVDWLVCHSCRVEYVPGWTSDPELCGLCKCFESG